MDRGALKKNNSERLWGDAKYARHWRLWIASRLTIKAKSGNMEAVSCASSIWLMVCQTHSFSFFNFGIMIYAQYILWPWQRKTAALSPAQRGIDKIDIDTQQTTLFLRFDFPVENAIRYVQILALDPLSIHLKHQIFSHKRSLTFFPHSSLSSSNLKGAEGISPASETGRGRSYPLNSVDRRDFPLTPDPRGIGFSPPASQCLPRSFPSPPLALPHSSLSPYPPFYLLLPSLSP